MIDELRYPYCEACKGSFPMRDSTFDALERSGSTFYCPDGHRLVMRQSDIVTLLRSSERFLQRSRDHVDTLEKSLNSVRGVITRQRNRLLRGVCPYCAKNLKGTDVLAMSQHIRERHDR